MGNISLLLHHLAPPVLKKPDRNRLTYYHVHNAEILVPRNKIELATSQERQHSREREESQMNVLEVHGVMGETGGYGSLEIRIPIPSW